MRIIPRVIFKNRNHDYKGILAKVDFDNNDELVKEIAEHLIEAAIDSIDGRYLDGTIKVYFPHKFSLFHILVHELIHHFFRLTKLKSLDKIDAFNSLWYREERLMRAQKIIEDVLSKQKEKRED